MVKRRYKFLINQTKAPDYIYLDRGVFGRLTVNANQFPELNLDLVLAATHPTKLS